MDIKFCSDDNIKKRVIDLLKDKLFSHGKNTIFTCDDLLEQRYEQMKCNFKEDKDKWMDIDNNNIIAKSSNKDITDDVLLASTIKNCPDYPFNFLSSFNNWGHDLPIWIEKDDNDKDKMRIMIIAQDPLRTNCEKGYIYFSSPFGLHSQVYREKDPSNVWKIINSLKNYKVQIYLTDYYKFYTTGGLKQLIGIITNGKEKLQEKINKLKLQEKINKLKKIDKSNPKKIKELEEIKSNFESNFEYIENLKSHIETIDLDKWAIDILKKEIGIWKPQLILTFGKEAAKNLPLKDCNGNKVFKNKCDYFKDYYYEVDGKQIKVILFPHPSGSNRKTLGIYADNLTDDGIVNMFEDKFKKILEKSYVQTNQ